MEEQPHLPHDLQYVPHIEHDGSTTGTIGDVASAVGAAVAKLPNEEVYQANTHIQQAAAIITEVATIPTADALTHAEEAVQASAGHSASAGYLLGAGAGDISNYLFVLGTIGKGNIPALPEINHTKYEKNIYPEKCFQENEVIQYEQSWLTDKGKNFYKKQYKETVLLGLDKIKPALFEHNELLQELPDSMGNTTGSLPPTTVSTLSYISEHHTPTPEAIATTSSVRERVDQALLGGFKKAVGGLDLTDLAIINEGSRPPRNLGDFKIVPVTSSYDTKESIVSIGFSSTLPSGVRCTYSGSGPYLDTSLALGLVKADRNENGELTGTHWLIAVASAGVNTLGDIVIKQIQDVTGQAGKSTPEDPKARFKTGLHSGFAWRDTLVNAWETIAATTHSSGRIVVQSAKNNDWGKVTRVPTGSTTGLPMGYPSYDAVADRLGYTYHPQSGNWMKTLPAIATAKHNEPAEASGPPAKNS